MCGCVCALCSTIKIIYNIVGGMPVFTYLYYLIK